MWMCMCLCQSVSSIFFWSSYVPEAKDHQADEQRKIMAMASYARHHPHRQPLHLAKSPRELLRLSLLLSRAVSAGP